MRILGLEGEQTSRLSYLAFPGIAPFPWLPPCSPFSIAKYFALLHIFSLFLPLSTYLGFPPPEPLPPRILPGSHPSCLLPPLTLYIMHIFSMVWALQWTLQSQVINSRARFFQQEMELKILLAHLDKPCSYSVAMGWARDAIGEAPSKNGCTR